MLLICSLRAIMPGPSTPRIAILRWLVEITDYPATSMKMVQSPFQYPEQLKILAQLRSNVVRDLAYSLLSPSIFTSTHNDCLVPCLSDDITLAISKDERCIEWLLYLDKNPEHLEAYIRENLAKPRLGHYFAKLLTYFLKFSPILDVDCLFHAQVRTAESRQTRGNLKYVFRSQYLQEAIENRREVGFHWESSVKYFLYVGDFTDEDIVQRNSDGEDVGDIFVREWTKTPQGKIIFPYTSNNDKVLVPAEEISKVKNLQKRLKESPASDLSTLNLFVGPFLQETLLSRHEYAARKLEVSHAPLVQSCLCQRLGNVDKVISHYIARGYLFYPLKQFSKGKKLGFERPGCNVVSPLHMRGWYASSTASVLEYVASDVDIEKTNDVRFCILRKLDWLAPALVKTKVSVSPQMKNVECSGIEDRRLLSISEFVDVYKKLDYITNLCAIMQPRSDDNTVWEESSRGFVLSVGWSSTPLLASLTSIEEEENINKMKEKKKEAFFCCNGNADAVKKLSGMVQRRNAKRFRKGTKVKSADDMVSMLEMTRELKKRDERLKMLKLNEKQKKIAATKTISLEKKDKYINSISNDIEPEEILELPEHISIQMVSSYDAMKNATFEIRNFCAMEANSVVGFDCEWASMGPTKGILQLVQLATREKCYLFDINSLLNGYRPLNDCIEKYSDENRLQHFSESLELINSFFSWLLNNVKVLGWGLHGDLETLWCSFPCIDCLRFPLQSCFDLQATFEKKFSMTCRLGLANASVRVLKKKMSKTEQCSNWSIRPLSQSQKQYAALDAFAMIVLYDHLDLDTPLIQEWLTPATMEMGLLLDHTMIKERLENKMKMKRCAESIGNLPPRKMLSEDMVVVKTIALFVGKRPISVILSLDLRVNLNAVQNVIAQSSECETEKEDVRLATNSELLKVWGCVPGSVGPAAGRRDDSKILLLVDENLSDKLLLCGAGTIGVSFCATVNELKEMRDVKLVDITTK